MELTKEQQEMLSGKHGNATKKSMEILVALGEIFGAKKLIPVSSVQIAGVSYDNLGEAGLEFIAEMAKDGKSRVFTTLNPAGMDMENWKALGISPEFAEKQIRVIEAFGKMGVQTTCTCTPYLIGNKPKIGEHIAWAESSAVCYANSVLGAKTNREGGPSAIASSLTGFTPEFGLHLDENRKSQITVDVEANIRTVAEFGALGKAIGDKIKNKIAYIRGIKKAGIEELKAYCASIATYGGTALFYMEGITPVKAQPADEKVTITQAELDKANSELNDSDVEVDFVSIGCPHCTLEELEHIAKLLEGKKVKKETWIHCARALKNKAPQKVIDAIEKSGAKFACDTCMVVAPIGGRFKGLATNSAKACFYGRGKNKFKIKFCDMDACIEEALE
jgi:predicted aconitase